MTALIIPACPRCGETTAVTEAVTRSSDGRWNCGTCNALFHGSTDEWAALYADREEHRTNVEADAIIAALPEDERAALLAAAEANTEPVPGLGKKLKPMVRATARRLALQHHQPVSAGNPETGATDGI